MTGYHPVSQVVFFAFSIFSQFGICIKTFLVLLSLGLDNDLIYCCPVSFCHFFSYCSISVFVWKRRPTIEIDVLRGFFSFPKYHGS